MMVFYDGEGWVILCDDSYFYDEVVFLLLLGCEYWIGYLGGFGIDGLGS